MSDGPSGFTLAEQIACVKREVRMRENRYPIWVAEGKMKPLVADRQLSCMRAVLRTMEALVAHSD